MPELDLEQLNKEMEKSVLELKGPKHAQASVEQERINNLNFHLRERIKELTGLYSLGRLTDEASDIEELFLRFLKEVVPPSMQFPTKTFGLIEFDGKLYHDTNITHFTDISHLESSIIVKGFKRGFLVIGYMEDLPFIPKFEQNLIDGYAERLGKIIERIKANDRVESARDQLRNIINSVSELIVSVDKTGRITFWNNSISELTGFSKAMFNKKSIFESSLPNELLAIFEIINSTLKYKRIESKELEIKDINGNTKVIVASTSLINGVRGDIEGVVFMGRDISSNKELYKEIAVGNSYMAYNEKFEDIIKIFNGFNEKGYSLFCVSREELSWLKNRLDHNAILLLMADKQLKSVQTQMDIEKILEAINSHVENNNKSVILLNRLDFIASKYGFNELIVFLYKLNDMVRLTDNIVLVHISLDSFQNFEISRLKEEFKEFPAPKKEKIHLDQKKIDILKFIANKNMAHQNVYYGLIRNEFGISKKTTKVWLNELENKELITTKEQGKRKLICITEGGRKLV